ncbi:hypothetical protein MASR1M32_14630 [Rhodobacter sp.]
MTQREIKRRKHYHEMAERLRRLEEALHDASPGAEAVPKAGTRSRRPRAQAAKSG